MKRIFYPFISLFISVIFLCNVSAKAQTYTITFPTPDETNNAPNGPLDQNDANGMGIETGVKFRVTQPGTVTGIRFLKGTPNTGVHIGHLWTNAGVLLNGPSGATFTETANGWQEVAISVHIVPGVIYVASVYNNVGDYSVQNGTWGGGADFGTPPIMVIAWSNDTLPDGSHNVGNGVYNYVNNGTNPTGLFPNSNNAAPNYWIGIRFLPDFPLPVVLSDFRATPANNDVLLSWKTQSETNSRGFEIQRSNNSADWYPVSFVNSAGQSTTTRSYNYTDKGLAPGLYYYRLRQTDIDGKSTFSSIVTATIGGKGAVSLFQNYPNPFNTTSTIRYDLPTTQKVRLSIVDMLGREVKVLIDNTSEAGSHLVTIDAASLQHQTYLVKLKTEDGSVLTQRILVE